MNRPYRPLAALSVFLVAFGVFATVQFADPGLFCNDSYFHVKMADLLSRKGPMRAFPWTTESLWTDSWADSSFLLHVFLVPFVRVFGPIVGAKCATAVLGGVYAVVVFVTAAWLGCPRPLCWTALASFGSSGFLLRFCSTRGYLISVPLTVLLVGALATGRLRLVFVLAVLFPLSYTAFHVVIALVLIHALSVRIAEGRFDWAPALHAFVGLALGSIAHPNFPNTLSLWWVQNIWVMGLRWTGAGNVNLGVELLDAQGSHLLSQYGILPVALAIVGLVILAFPRDRSARMITVAQAAGLFLLLTLSSMRFLEYSIALTLLLAGSLLGDLAQDRRTERLGTSPSVPALLDLSGRGGIVLFLLAGLVSLTSVSRSIRIASGHKNGQLAEAARWLALHTAPGTLVVAEWDIFSEFFYYNDHNRMLVGLEPTFFLYRNAHLHMRFREVLDGRSEDPYGVVRYVLGARWLLLTPKKWRLLAQVRKDPRFIVRIDTSDCSVFELGP